MRRPPHANDAPHRVVIVGGGFGGLYAARALKRAPVEITLVDRANHHLFQPLLYQVATGILTEGEIAPPLRGLLRRQRNARVLLAEVTDFDLDARTVIAGELEIPYDSLIVAAGATVDHRGPDDGSELAPGLKSLDDAREVRSRILRAFEMAELADDPRERAAWLRFAVVGGGPTGVEIAGQVADLARSTLRPDYRRIDTAAASWRCSRSGRSCCPTSPSGSANARRATSSASASTCTSGRRRPHWTPTASNLPTASASKPGPSCGRPASRRRRWRARSPTRRARASTAPAGSSSAATSRCRGTRTCSRSATWRPFRASPASHPPPCSRAGTPRASSARGSRAGRTPGTFRYLDKGQLAVVGHNRAVGAAFGLGFSGRLALLMWAVVHVRYLLGWGNRLVTVMRWLWTMAARNRGQRVIASHGSLKAPTYNAPVNI